MLELESVLIGALQAAEICAARAQPAVLAGRVSSPCCTLALRQAEAAEAAFGQYLGLLEDEERGEVELYGRRFEATAELCLYAPSSTAQLCTLSDQVLEVLMGLPGLTIRDFSLDASHWDDDANAYSRTMTLRTSGLLYYLHSDEDGWFTDFSLVPDIS